MYCVHDSFGYFYLLLCFTFYFVINLLSWVLADFWLAQDTFCSNKDNVLMKVVKPMFQFLLFFF